MINRLTLLSYLRDRDRGFLLSLILAAFLLYLPFLGNPFKFDDVAFISGGMADKYAHSWFHFDLRWLPHASLGWTQLAFSDVATHLYHLGNLLLHAANAILLFYLLRQLAGAAVPGEQGRAVVWGAWFGALMFALHPVAVYAAGYVVQRSILMATAFVLVMQLAYLRGVLTGQARWLALAAAAYFMAVFAKEHSVMAPALLAAETVLLRRQLRIPVRALGGAWAAFFAIALLIILRAKGVFGTPYEAMAADLFRHEGIGETGPMLHLLSVMTQAGLFFKYLLLWVAPNPAWMSIDMREPFVASWLSWQGLLGVAGFAGYGALAVWLLLRSRWAGLAGLALLYPWLQFVLEFSSIRVQEPFVLYRSYLWMPGLALFIPLLAAKWPRRRTLAALGMAAVLLASLAANRLWVFADPYRLWNDAALLLPNDKAAGADRIYYNRGQAEEGVNKMDLAIADFQHAAAISPQYAPIHFELGWAYFRTNRLDEALAQFDTAIAADPKFALGYYGKAMLLKQRHEDRAAAALMLKSCEFKNEMACLIVKGRIDH